MKTYIKRGVSVIVISFLTLFLLLIIVGEQNITCTSPFLIGATTNQPEMIAKKIISTLNGLPKTNMDIYEALKLQQSGTPLLAHPVKDWRIETSTVTNNFRLSTLFDDDPTYWYQFNIAVTYDDGEEKILQWQSWRYGLVICPVIIARGDGPPGQLKILR